MAWPSNIAWEHIKPIIRLREPLLCGSMFANSWLDRPISVQDFYHCYPVQGELALLQVHIKVQDLRDTVGRERKIDA